MKVLDSDLRGLKKEPYLLTNLQVLDWIEQSQTLRSADSRQLQGVEHNAQDGETPCLLDQVKSYLVYSDGPLDRTSFRNVKMRNCQTTIGGLARILKAEPYNLPKKYILQIFNLRPRSVDVLLSIFEGTDYSVDLAKDIIEHVRQYLGPVETEVEAKQFEEAQNRLGRKMPSEKGL